jgi:hypothetical protein
MTAYMVNLFKMVDQKKEGYWAPFEEIIQTLRNDILDKQEEKCGNRQETLWENLIYGMRVKSAWSQLKERFHQFSRT